MTSNLNRRHERCLFGSLHLKHGMKLLILVGVAVIGAVLGFMLLHFRKAIFVLSIPAVVTLATAYALLRSDQRFLWPIVGISFFHVFVSLYAGLIFLFYFCFKPLYIIMVLNWAFDTLHTEKTTSYYLQCAAIFASIVVFGVFNAWQARVALAFWRLLSLKAAGAAEKASPIVVVVNGTLNY
ncbi:hypothetical protein QR680_009570 [Steinernema hermaphroditum]|uniref:DUF4203 domain-containing protein n=1 Tax=Steinernema hermaphroditum TaxID=289476 RepID=A0AA39IKT9_9BILA|nr:hypothetical protein QR680_009570 [Steinernema hermaphroditum]